MLIAVFEQNGGSVYALVFRGKVDKAHDLRECEAVEESADGRVVFENTLPDRPFIEQINNMIDLASICAECKILHLKQIFVIYLVSFPLKTVCPSTAICEINIYFVMEILIFYGDAMLCPVAEVIERQRTAFVTVFLD